MPDFGGRRGPAPTLTELTLEAVDAVAPVWRTLYEHHVGLAGDVAAVIPVRGPDDAWLSRRASYERGLREPGGFGLIAAVEGRPVGYAVARMKADPRDSWRR